MTRRLIIASVLGFVILAGLLVWRAEPLYLSWLAGKTESSTLEARKTLIAQNIEVHLPETGDGPFPSVLMFHGCAGPRMAFMRQWADVFTQEGFAAMVVDSTGPRGFDRQDALDVVCAGKALLGQERAGDIFAAIDIAKTDKRLDTDNLILAGWSHGAWTVMDFLTMDGEKRRPAGINDDLAAPPDIKGLVLFYPHCGPAALSKFRAWRATPPTVAFIAGADKIVESEKCVSLFERKIRSGANIEMTVYPEADHVFDDPFLEPEWSHWHREDDHRDAEKRVRAFLKGLAD